MRNPYGMPINSPCTGCTDRKPKCHSDCQKYDAFKAEISDFRKKTKVPYTAAKVDKMFRNEKPRGGIAQYDK